MTPTSPPGSETVARHQGRVGNSGDPQRSSNPEVEWHDPQTGRKLKATVEVGCPHSSEETE
jgi:hypothetical protein